MLNPKLCCLQVIFFCLASSPLIGQDLDHFHSQQLSGHFLSAKRIATDLVKKHGDTCRSCQLALGMTLFELGDLTGAWENLRQVQKRQERMLPRDHAEVLDTLMKISWVYLSQADFYMAEYGWDRVRLTLENKTHPQKALNLAYLANFWQLSGNHEKARHFFELAEKDLQQSGMDPWKKITVLKLLGAFASQRRQYDQADQWLEKARRLSIRTFGPKHFQTLLVQVVIANLALDLGDFKKALLLFQTTGAQLEKHLEAPHLIQADVAYGRAYANLQLGRGKAGLRYAEKAQTIRASQLGENHVSQAESRLLLARTYLSIGLPSKALPLAEKALAHTQQLYEKDHLIKARAFSCLADSLEALGYSTKALGYWYECLNMKKRLLGSEHEDVLRLQILLERKDPNVHSLRSAEEYLATLKDLETRREACHPTMVILLTSYAKALLHEGRPGEALAYLQRITRCQNEGIDLNSPDSIDHQANLALCHAALGNESAMMHHIQQVLDEEEAWSSHLFSLASEKDNLAWFQEVESRFSILFELLMAPESRSNDRIALGFEMAMRRKGWLLDLAIHKRRGIGALTAKEQTLFAQLSGTKKELSEITQNLNPETYDQDTHNRIHFLRDQQDELERGLSGVIHLPARSANHLSQRVVQAIPEDACLIEILKYGNQNPTYGAFWASRDQAPQFLPLGPVSEIEGQIDKFRTAILYRNEQRLKEAGEALALLLVPILNSHAHTRILVAADGEFHLFPLEALPWKGRFLVETYQFSYLSGGRALLQKPIIKNRGNITLFAAADYGLPRNQLAYKYLSHTIEEARRIGNIMSSTPMTQFQGKDASEAALKRVQSPRILHLATHGYYASKPKSSAKTATLPNAVEDPLSRSGLVFAGVNEGGDGRENGVLTALEALSLDLVGTELVVLSACSSGRGEHILGSGVYGMRRAFQIAGARQLISSLWPVPDGQSTDLMAGFYQSYRKRALAGVALHQAMLERIRVLRDSEQIPHPLLWAGFIHSGIDRK